MIILIILISYIIFLFHFTWSKFYLGSVLPPWIFFFQWLLWNICSSHVKHIQTVQYLHMYQTYLIRKIIIYASQIWQSTSISRYNNIIIRILFKVTYIRSPNELLNFITFLVIKVVRYPIEQVGQCLLIPSFFNLYKYWFFFH